MCTHKQNQHNTVIGNVRSYRRIVLINVTLTKIV